VEVDHRRLHPLLSHEGELLGVHVADRGPALTDAAPLDEVGQFIADGDLEGGNVAVGAGEAREGAPLVEDEAGGVVGRRGLGVGRWFGRWRSWRRRRAGGRWWASCVDLRGGLAGR